MLTRQDDVDAHAVHRQGWTISAIARHLGHDRKAIRAYLKGDRVAGQRRPGPTRSSPTARERLAEDPHLWAQTLFDEVVAIGYDRSYPTFTRQLRTRGRRPHCEPCAPARGRASAVIAHPPGEETQGTGSSFRTRRSTGAGAAGRSCWSARSRTPAAGAGCWHPAWISHTSSTRSTGSPSRSAG